MAMTDDDRGDRGDGSSHTFEAGDATPPAWLLVAHASDDLRRDVLVFWRSALLEPEPRPVASVYTLADHPPVIGIPIGLAYTPREWQELTLALAEALAYHARLWPAELRKKEVADVARAWGASPNFWETDPVARRWTAQEKERQAIRDELAAAREPSDPVTAYQVTAEQRRRAEARGEPLVTHDELRRAAATGAAQGAP